MGCLLRNARQPVAAFTPRLTGTSIFLVDRDGAEQCVGMYHPTHVRKPAGIGTMRRSRMDQGVRPGARMPGRSNGSNLSLVIRAVNSNIFMKGWNSPLAMKRFVKIDEWEQGPLCEACGEFEAKWLSNASRIIYCKYCHVYARGISAPVPAYMKEMIPLE